MNIFETIFREIWEVEKGQKEKVKFIIDIISHNSFFSSQHPITLMIFEIILSEIEPRLTIGSKVFLKEKLVAIGIMKKLTISILLNMNTETETSP